MLLWHFPPSLHNEIRADVGMSEPEVSLGRLGGRGLTVASTRPRSFVLRCSKHTIIAARSCEFDIRLGGQPLGLEAAHVKWHAYGGPDDIRNGLAFMWLPSQRPRPRRLEDSSVTTEITES